MTTNEMLEDEMPKGNGLVKAIPVAMQLAAQLGAVRDHLVASFPEREGAVDAILTAAVAGEHVLMVGPPGTGKSALAREFSRCIGGSFYEYLFSKFTTPEEFLGPFSISGLKQDRYDRVLTGRLAEADVAFLDEIFKSNSASLNCLLPILNERIVFQGGGASAIPLRIVVAASNELPTDPSLQAMWDRLLLRCFVEPLVGESNRRLVMLGGQKQVGPRPSIDLTLLDALDLDAAVPMPAHVLDTMLTLRRELESKGVVHGDRRWVKAVRLVRAFALVCGHTSADTMALSILKSVLWDKTAQRDEVTALINKVSAPHVMKARELLDELMAEVGSVKDTADTEDLSKAMGKMKTAHARILKQAKTAPEGRERNEVKAIAVQVANRFNHLRDIVKTRYGLLDEGEV